jgi:hypothetical protein
MTSATRTRNTRGQGERLRGALMDAARAAARTQAIPTFPWPAEADYVERMIQVQIDALAGRA